MPKTEDGGWILDDSEVETPSYPPRKNESSNDDDDEE